MRVTNISVTPYWLPLRKAWRSAGSNFNTRHGFLVTVEDDASHCGYGDCAPLNGSEDESQAKHWLDQRRPLLIGLTTEAALEALPPARRCPPAARCGLETAMLDLIAAQHLLPLYRWLEPRSSCSVRVNTNLGSLDRETDSPSAAAATGVAVVKLKIGLLSVSQDIENLQRYAATLPEGMSLRLDANQAWSMQQARAFIAGAANLPVECLEEPLQNPSCTGLERLQRLASFPLALDESLTQLSHEEVLYRKPVARLVLKPMLLGGPGAALTIARKARLAGLECVVTTTVDSAVGSWAAVHLAAAVDAGHNVMSHGLGTSCWLARDIATPPPIHNGKITLGDSPGLGIRLTH